MNPSNIVQHTVHTYRAARRPFQPKRLTLSADSACKLPSVLRADNALNHILLKIATYRGKTRVFRIDLQFHTVIATALSESEIASAMLMRNSPETGCSDKDRDVDAFFEFNKTISDARSAEAYRMR